MAPDRGRGYLRAMMTDGQFKAFVVGLRNEQLALRKEMAPYEEGTMRVFSGPPDGPMVEITAERIRQIKHEIASKERVIEIVTAERRGSNA